MKKTCSKCKIEKEITEFSKAWNNRDDHDNTCKCCRNASNKRRYEEAKVNHLYKVECPYGYYYIGSTTLGIKVRMHGHWAAKKSTLSKHIKENSLSKEDLKYSVVKEFKDPEEMRIAERELIKSCYTDPFLLNAIIPLRNDSDMSKRFCSKCKIEKPIEEFYWCPSRNIYATGCKKCIYDQQKLYNQANKEKIAKQRKEYRECNKEHLAKKGKEYYEANKEKEVKRGKEYREANKEKIAKRQNEYYEANKEKIAKRQNEYNQANKEKIAKKNKAWYEANREKEAKRGKEYREANKEKEAKRGKEYREANKEKIAKRLKAYYEVNKEKIAKKNKAWYRARKKLLDKQ